MNYFQVKVFVFIINTIISTNAQSLLENESIGEFRRIQDDLTNLLHSLSQRIIYFEKKIIENENGLMKTVDSFRISFDQRVQDLENKFKKFEEKSSETNENLKNVLTQTKQNLDNEIKKGELACKNNVDSSQNGFNETSQNFKYQIEKTEVITEESIDFVHTTLKQTTQNLENNFKNNEAEVAISVETMHRLLNQTVQNLENDLRMSLSTTVESLENKFRKNEAESRDKLMKNVQILEHKLKETNEESNERVNNMWKFVNQTIKNLENNFKRNFDMSNEKTQKLESQVKKNTQTIQNEELNRTMIVVILDESLFMTRSTADVIKGYNLFLQEQKELQADKARLTLFKFGSNVTHAHAILDLCSAPALNTNSYNPDGWAAFYDAITDGINYSSITRLSDERVLVLIVTDGGENNSKYSTGASVQNLIATHEALGKWTFGYIGYDRAWWVTTMNQSISNTDDFSLSPGYNFRTATNAATRFRKSHLPQMLQGLIHA